MFFFLSQSFPSRFIVPVVYIVIVRDSKYVIENRLDMAHSLEEEDQRLGKRGLDREVEAQLLQNTGLDEQEDLVRLLLNSSVTIIPARELQLEESIGAGGYGQVWKACWKNLSVAAKRLHGVVQGDSLLREMALLSTLRHPNTLLLIGIVLEHGQHSLVSEYCENGSLYDHLSGRKKHTLDWPTKLQIARGIASGMVYLHSKEIIHRDLS